VMDRWILSDAAWERMAPLIIGRADQKGSTGRDNRMFVEGVLWIVRTGSPWRDLPEAFGNWFRRFSRWSIKGVWRRIFEAMSDDPDFEYLIGSSSKFRRTRRLSRPTFIISARRRRGYCPCYAR
jgi:transposase